MQKDRNFEDVVRSIAASEGDVDKVLDAARLERSEGPGRHLTGQQKYTLLLTALGVTAFFGFLFALVSPFVMR